MRAGQAFALDLILAIVIMLVVSVFVLSTQFISQTPSTVVSQAHIVAAGMLAPVPLDWNSSNAISPGIAINHHLNASLLDRFLNLPFGTLEDLYAVQGEVYINMTLPNGTWEYGYPPMDADNIGHVDRIVAMNGTLVTIGVTVWE